jgi:UDP-glucose 4-epimerase
MAVMVTGALGALGSAVVRRLVTEGEKTIAFDARDETSLIGDLLDDVQVEIGDIRDWTRLARVVASSDVEGIIHMAALLPDEAQRNPRRAVEVNVNATCDICELARVFGLRRVVFSSSKGVYKRVTGQHAAPTYTPLDESYPIGPDGVYDVTKYAAEQMGLNYALTHGVDFVACRFAATYGPGRMSRHGSLAIRSAIVENAFHGVPTVVPRGGEQQDDFVYSKDVAKGLVRAYQAEAPEHRIYNIGTGEGSTLARAAEFIRSVVPGAEIEVGPGLDYGTGAGRYCIFDISRARAELDYEPDFDHEAGIRDYLEVLETREAAARAGG